VDGIPLQPPTGLHQPVEVLVPNKSYYSEYFCVLNGQMTKENVGNYAGGGCWRGLVMTDL
jgi:hypothetical protein